MSLRHPAEHELEPHIRQFYENVLRTLTDHAIRFMVGGGFALDAYTGISRRTKDIDIFVLPEDVPLVLERLDACGYATEITYEHWIAKAYHEGEFVDIIYNSGNGLCPVDEGWFEHASSALVFGIPCRMCPPEELIWQKAFIMERERFDGADIAHLLRACGASLSWQRLLTRFGEYWRVLLSHLILFGFIYPQQRIIPDWVMETLIDRLQQETSSGSSAPANRCFGTLLSLAQYKIDIDQWGYEDARLHPTGTLTLDELQRWRRAIEKTPP